METKYCHLKARTWLTAAGVVAALGALAVAAGIAPQVASMNHAAAGAAWYAEPSAPAGNSTAAVDPAATSEATKYAKGMSRAFHDAANKVLPAVVMITNAPALAEQTIHRKGFEQDSDDGPNGIEGTPFGEMLKDPSLRRFFKQFPQGPGQGLSERGTSVGSGVIVEAAGVVLTNNHVVAGNGKVTVRLQDGREFKAVDIKTDPKSDLAVLRLEGASALPVARLGNSSQVDIGDWVVALGQPFGLEGTVTAGIVSAKERGIGINDREDFIQTDAAINPGNSGGPLVNLDGEVIGINTAISSNSGGYQGVGFAIPANLAKWVGGQLEKNGTVHRAYLGVGIQQVTPTLAEQFKVKVHEGVLVTEVRSNTPAAKAGLKPGDVILDFDGKAVSNPRQLQGLVEMCQVNGKETVTVLREGKRLTLNINCSELPADSSVAQGRSHGAGKGDSSNDDALGLQVASLSPQVAEQLGIKAESGVVITDVRAGSPAAQAGLTNGLVITEVNRQPVKSVEDWRQAMSGKSLEKGVLLLVRSAEGSRFVALTPERE